MTALNDIQRDIDRTLALAEREAGHPLSPAAKRWARAKRLKVMVGASAAQSIIAATGDEGLPETIDDVPVERTENFDGFEVVIL